MLRMIHTRYRPVQVTMSPEAVDVNAVASNRLLSRRRNKAMESRTLYDSEWQKHGSTLNSRIAIRHLIKRREIEHLNHSQKSIDPLRNSGSNDDATLEYMH